MTDAMIRVKAWLENNKFGLILFNEEIVNHYSDVASLVKELENLKQPHVKDCDASDVTRLEKELEATRKQLERAEKALGFYKDRSVYYKVSKFPGDYNETECSDIAEAYFAAKGKD